MVAVSEILPSEINKIDPNRTFNFSTWEVEDKLCIPFNKIKTLDEILREKVSNLESSVLVAYKKGMENLEGNKEHREWLEGYSLSELESNLKSISEIRVSYDHSKDSKYSLFFALNRFTEPNITYLFISGHDLEDTSLEILRDFRKTK